jgi:hypothetical protein
MAIVSEKIAAAGSGLPSASPIKRAGVPSGARGTVAVINLRRDSLAVAIAIFVTVARFNRNCKARYGQKSDHANSAETQFRHRPFLVGGSPWFEFANIQLLLPAGGPRDERRSFKKTVNNPLLAALTVPYPYGENASAECPYFELHLKGCNGIQQQPW